MRMRERNKDDVIHKEGGFPVFPPTGNLQIGHGLHGFMHCICQQSSFFGGNKEL